MDASDVLKCKIPAMLVTIEVKSQKTVIINNYDDNSNNVDFRN